MLTHVQSVVEELKSSDESASEGSSGVKSDETSVGGSTRETLATDSQIVRQFFGEDEVTGKGNFRRFCACWAPARTDHTLFSVRL